MKKMNVVLLLLSKKHMYNSARRLLTIIQIFIENLAIVFGFIHNLKGI